MKQIKAGKLNSSSAQANNAVAAGKKDRKAMAHRLPLAFLLPLLAVSLLVSAQNPLVRTMYSADPTARVFNNKIYVFPSHDILATKDRGREGWFCMEDYHVYSSANLTEWTDHGMIVTQNKVPWVRPDSYSMWAPDCIERNGKYYFYFPSAPKDTTKYGRGFTVGVAIANKPEGPYVPQPEPIAGIRGIDPNVFIDKDGQAYLYWSQGNIYGAKLKDNMVELASEVKTMQGLPTDRGLKEGPFVFERGGKYYMTYPHVADKTERLEYAIGDNPLGPFKVTGVIMDETPGCWTNHHSILPYNKQWYLFYHANDYSPNFDKARAIRADSLQFNADGTIQKVKPTLRGIGITDAAKPVQMDRYSRISSAGASVDFIDTNDRFLGWKTVLNAPGAWVQYDKVQFAKGGAKSVVVRAKASKGGTLQLRSGSHTGPIMGEWKIAAGNDWQELTAPLRSVRQGLTDLVLVAADGGETETDWIQFK